MTMLMLVMYGYSTNGDSSMADSSYKPHDGMCSGHIDLSKAQTSISGMLQIVLIAHHL